MKLRLSPHALEQMERRRLDRALVERLLENPRQVRDEGNPGVILDYDREGNVVGIEILDASKRVEDPRRIEYLADTATR